MFKKLLTSILLTLVAVGGFLMQVNFDRHDIQSITIHYSNAIYAADGGETTLMNNGQEVDVSKGGANQAAASLPAKATATEDAKIREMYDTLVAGLNIILSMLTIIVTPAIMFASWLISPDWTSGDLFGIRPILHSLWVVIFNITYVIYAVLLIVIALATIFNSEHYGYKAMLPKLALGMILVPLTWWMVQFVISLSALVTASVITIPQETMFQINADKCQGDTTKCWENRANIPKRIVFWGSTQDDSESTKKMKSDSTHDSVVGKNCTPASCYTPKEFLSNLGGTYGQLLVYAYSVFNISDVKILPTGVDHVKTILDIVHQGLIGVIMFLVFGLLVLALVFMLLARAIKLWIYAIFSPLFTLSFVMGGEVFGSENKDSFSIKEFLGLAFVPAIVGLALSFGLVIISALQSGEISGGNKCTVDQLKTAEGCQLLGIMGNTNNKIIRKSVPGEFGGFETVNELILGGVTLVFYGNPGSPDKIAEETSSASSVLSSAGGILGRIIIDIIALIFIWIAFMAAKGVSKTVSAAVAPFESMGKKIGEIGMSLPKYAPIPGTGGLSMKSMEKVPMSIESAIQKHDSDKFEKSSLGKMLHADANIPPNIAKNITDAIASGERSKYEQVVKDNAAFINRPNGYNAGIIEEFMKQVQKDPTYLDTLNLSSEQKVKFKEFQGKDLKNDNTRKEAWNLWLATVGAGNKGNGEKNRTNDSGYTLEKNPITDNQLLIHLGGTTINVEQFKGKNPTEIAKIVSDGINAKKAEFTKKPINMDDLQKLFDSYGLTSAEIIAAIKKEPITNDLWQPKTGTTPEPKK